MLVTIDALRRLEHSLIFLFKTLQDGQLADATLLGKQFLNEWTQKNADAPLKDVLLKADWEGRYQRTGIVMQHVYESNEGSVTPYGPIGSPGVSRKCGALVRLLDVILEFAWDEDEDAAPRLRSAIREYFKWSGSVLTLKARPASNIPTIISLGDRQYSIGSAGPYTLTVRQNIVLQAFLKQTSMDRPTLVKRSGYEDPHRILKSIAKTYEAFAPAIRFPGKKAKGGYSVSIRELA